jgi:hypothetical protein
VRGWGDALLHLRCSHSAKSDFLGDVTNTLFESGIIVVICASKGIPKACAHQQAQPSLGGILLLDHEWDAVNALLVGVSEL